MPAPRLSGLSTPVGAETSVPVGSPPRRPTTRSVGHGGAKGSTARPTAYARSPANTTTPGRASHCAAAPPASTDTMNSKLVTPRRSPASCIESPARTRSEGTKPSVTAKPTLKIIHGKAATATSQISRRDRAASPRAVGDLDVRGGELYRQTMPSAPTAAAPAATWKAPGKPHSAAIDGSVNKAMPMPTGHAFIMMAMAQTISPPVNQSASIFVRKHVEDDRARGADHAADHDGGIALGHAHHRAPHRHEAQSHQDNSAVAEAIPEQAAGQGDHDAGKGEEADEPAEVGVRDVEALDE